MLKINLRLFSLDYRSENVYLMTIQKVICRDRAKFLPDVHPDNRYLLSNTDFLAVRQPDRQIKFDIHLINVFISIVCSPELAAFNHFY